MNLRFHNAIAEAARNPIAVLVMQAISEPLVNRSPRADEMPGAAEAGVRQHWAIHRAMRNRNPDKARTAMRLHIQGAGRNGRMAHTDGAGA